MFDEEHVGIRSPKDIKTFEECIRDADEDSVFGWGDYTKEDAIRDLKRNKVRVYSSYAIKNGVFVSTSYRQALDYAGNDPTKVHSKEVNPNRVAWINGDEGQYASVSIAPTSKGNIKYSKFDSGEYENFLQDNFSNDGTKTYMEDIKLPSKIANLKDELRSIVDKSKDMDSEMKDSLIELINNTDDEKELQSYKESLQHKAPVKSGTIKITNYKNAKLNSKVVNNALSMIEANKQGKRTKTQWLQVAEQIGMNIKKSEIDKYAYKTWSDFLPNQKNNLNRQGEKYVPFTRDEWIKAVEEGYKKSNAFTSVDNEINKFNGYTNKEIENISSDKITIATSKKSISDFVRSLKNKFSNKKMYVGKVTSETANRVEKELSCDIENYNISINSSGINHSYNNHGDLIIEQRRGQVPITENDFENIYDIVNKADKISLIGKDSENHELIQFEKNIDGNNVFVAYISKKHKNLELKTLYKFKNNKKNPVTAFNIDKSTLNYTSETNSDTDSINNIIPSEQNYVNNNEIIP